LTVEQHLQQLIGTLAIQLAQKDATIDILNERVQALEKNQCKPEKATDDSDQPAAESK
jgi:hypothetical protein